MHEIDVIIPVKGRPEVLSERSLPSLRAQHYTSFQVTIVDDGSTVQESKAIRDTCSEFSDLNIRILENLGMPGAAGARNFGFEQSEAPYVLWFDSDDVLLPNKLDHSISLIKSGANDFAVSRAQHIVNGSLTNAFWGAPRAPEGGYHSFHFPFQTMCALHSRKFLLKKDIRWNEELNTMNDWEFSNRCVLESRSWTFSNLVTSHYHVPSKTSESLGSNLSSRKIESQKLAMALVSLLMNEKGLVYSKVDQLRVVRHKFYLWYRSTFN